MEDREITVLGVTVATRKISVSESVYRQAVADERLDEELDAWLSGMSEQTVVIEPDGTVVSPYGGPDDLMELAVPILAEIPTWVIEQYVAGRRADEE